MSDVPTLDLERVRVMREALGDEVMARLLTLFVGGVKGDLEALAAVQAACDADGERRILHSICGRALNVGANRMAEVAREAQAAPDRSANAALAGRLRDLLDEFELEAARVYGSSN